MRALERRPTTLERWPKGVHPGIVLSTRDRGGGDAFFQKRIPKGAPEYVETARIQFPSGREADEVCPTEIAVVGWAAQMGTITFHPWPVRRDDVDHPDELRLDLDPQPGTDFADAVRVAGEARGCWTSSATSASRRPRAAGASTSTSGSSRAGRSPTSATPRSRFGRELERRLPEQVTTKLVEGGARRADLHRLQPERARSHDRLRLQRPPQAGRPGVGAARPGTSCPRSRPRTSRSRRCPLGSPSAATSTPRSTTSPHSLQPLLDLYERDRRRATCPTRPTTRRCRASPSACSPRATATARGTDRSARLRAA